jgi:hypothetical protein
MAVDPVVRLDAIEALKQMIMADGIDDATAENTAQKLIDMKLSGWTPGKLPPDQPDSVQQEG